jgi:hypothetical protein
METEDSITQPATKIEVELARVSVKIPSVWRKNIQVWFVQIEAQFSTAGITNENTSIVVLGTDPEENTVSNNSSIVE